MEKFNLTQTGAQVQQILNDATPQTDLANEIERAQGAEQTLQDNIDEEELRAKAAEHDLEQADGTLQGNIDAEELRAKAAEQANRDLISGIQAKIPSAAASDNPLVDKSYVDTADASMQSAIEGILALIPQAATALNQLADKAFVNSSIATNTGTFKGTYNVVLDLELFYDADHAQIALMLGSKIISAKNNDYCYVQVPNSNEAPTSINHTDRYKFNGTSWAYEYTLNNSGFTSAQWFAINSGITELLKNKLVDLPTATELAALLDAKQNQLTFDTTPASGSTNPVTSEGIHAAIDNEKERAITAEETLQENIDGEETRAQDAESTLQDNIETERARALAAEQGLLEEYEELYALYQTLQGGNIIPVAAADWPLSNLQQNVIYRVANSATPTGYSDYMYNGTNTILLATFSFPGIDDKPTAGSTNLAYSGGIHASILQDGPAFDLSAHNAVGGTLATYADLNAALAALNALPAAYKYGGMSFKYVQTSDNKYVQARCMAQNFTTDVTQWQGVDDEIADNNNLISNAGVYRLKDELLIGTQSKTITDEAFVNNGNMYNKGIINSSNTNYRNTDLIPVKTGDVVTIDYNLYDTYQYGAFEAVCLYGLNVAGYLSKSSFADAPKPVLTVTQDGYVRFCKKATDTDGSAIHIYHNGGELNEINEKLDELTYTGNANIQLKEADFKHVGSLLPDGTIYTSNTDCICTDLIEVGQNKNIVTNLYASYGLRTWVQYAEDGVTAVADSGNVLSASLRTFTMNSAAKYIRFCWQYKEGQKKPFPVVKYEGSVVSEIDNIKSKITTLETKHNIEYYSKDFELEDRGGGYINSNTGAAEYSKTGYASPWIPLRKGTYKIKTESNCYVTVYRHVHYQKDYTIDDGIVSVTTTANVESILVLSEAGFMRVSPVGSVTTGAEGIHIEQFGELEGDMPVLPTWDKLHISGFDNSNIWLYIPMGSGVFEIVNLKHYTSGGFAYMMEHWGIEMCYLSTNANDKTIVTDYPITRASEYEQAIDIVSDTHNGYIGGHMHGYEQMDSIQIKVDGVTRNDYHFSDDCEQVEIIQYSTLYETDKSTEIAKVTKRWAFDNKKFDTFINTIFSKGVTINRCMTAMFGILRRLDPETQGGERGSYLTNKGMKDTSWQIVSTTDGWDNPSTYTDGAQMLMAGNNEATHLEQWGDLGYKTVLEVPKASRLTGAGMLIDTNGGTYNKMYYDCGSGQMNIGDYIFSHAIFKFGRFLV